MIDNVNGLSQVEEYASNHNFVILLISLYMALVVDNLFLKPKYVSLLGYYGFCSARTFQYILLFYSTLRMNLNLKWVYNLKCYVYLPSKYGFYFRIF
jgi:hypothetical protein